MREKNAQTLRVKYLFPAQYPGEERAQWGFVHTREDAEREKAVIEGELKGIRAELAAEGTEVTFEGGEIVDSSQKLLGLMPTLSQYDAVISFGLAPASHPAGEWGSLAGALAASTRHLVIFLKMYGSEYYGDTLFAPPFMQYLKRIGWEGRGSLVTDDYEELKSLLRALLALKEMATTRILYVGYPNPAFGGWLTWGRSQELFGIETVRFYSFEEAQRDFEELWEDKEAQEEAKRAVEAFTEDHEVLEPTEEKLQRAATFYLLIERYIEGTGANAVTVHCLAEIQRMVQATPCMAFSLLNDRGIVSSCEADPTGIPAHLLTTYLAHRPSFFTDPTISPGEGRFILAHCTSPTRLLGYEESPFPYRVRTHHESNLAATDQPQFAEGEVTVAGFSFELDKLLVAKGHVVGTPDLPICRAQVEIEVKDAVYYLHNWQGFHWMMVYGDYTGELRHVCRMKGIEYVGRSLK